MPRVSAVLSVLNGERFLAGAIDSILHQTLDSFELIVVNDGSTDGTKAIVDAYTWRDARVRAVHFEQNKGVREAANEGCRLARGEFIARMDADDLAAPTRFHQQVSYLERHPDVGAVGTALQLIGDGGATKGIKRYPAEPSLVAWSMLFFCSVAHPTLMVRRDVLESVGYYPSGFRVGVEDYALLMRLTEATRVANLEEPLYHYRMWAGNTTSTKFDVQEQQAVRVLRQTLHRRWGMEISEEEASLLRGLSTDRFPATAEQMLVVGNLVQLLVTEFLADERWDAREVRQVRRDAGVRLLLLAALSARHSLRTSAALATAGLRSSPLAAVEFATKVARRFSARRR